MADINEWKKGKEITKRYNAEVTQSYLEECMQGNDKIFPKRWGIDFYHTYKEDLKRLGKDGLGFGKQKAIGGENTGWYT